MTQRFIDFLKEQDVEFKEGFDIKSVSSIGIGGKAKVAVFPSSEEELLKAVKFLLNSNMGYKIVGNATNILFPDTDYTNVLILTKKNNRYFVKDKTLHVSCGALFSSVIRKISCIGYGGLEELYGIPGSVGGMIFGNAGAYGKSVSDVTESVKVYSPDSDRVLERAADELCFSYRNSNLKHSREILLSATVKLSPDTTDNIQSRLVAVIEQRHSTQPRDKSLGSVFKRYHGNPVSKMIDDLGMKGFSVGGAEISQKHAGFIVNTGGASSTDVRELIGIVKKRIKLKYGFVPEEEIEILKQK